MLISGDDLVAIISEAKREAVIAAPFIKIGALSKLLSRLPHSSIKTSIITRWRPNEVALGVSDLEVFDLTCELTNTELFIQPNLHAKYFRVDDTCIAGSANITNPGLGWSSPGNLEIMVSIDRDDAFSFERRLFHLAFLASNDLRYEIKAEADRLKGEGLTSATTDNDHASDRKQSIFWLPLCPKPEQLFQIYSELQLHTLIESTIQSGINDLKNLGIPKGLSEDNFYNYIRSAIAQSRIYETLTKYDSNGVSADEGTSLLTEQLDSGALIYTPDDHWEIVKAWLLYFMPDAFRERFGSSDLQFGKTIFSM